jgi:hypothetical protein
MICNVCILVGEGECTCPDDWLTVGRYQDVPLALSLSRPVCPPAPRKRARPSMAMRSLVPRRLDFGPPPLEHVPVPVPVSAPAPVPAPPPLVEVIDLTCDEDVIDLTGPRLPWLRQQSAVAYGCPHWSSELLDRLD